MARRFDVQAGWVFTLVTCVGLFVSAPANSVVIPMAELYNTSVPANGVLRFSIWDGVSVRILAADGSEVPGGFVAEGVWRPDEPFIEGTYTADITWDDNPTWANDATFQVTAAVDPASELVRVQVTSRVDADSERVITRECCLAGESRPPDPCDGACPPLCVPTKWEAKQVVSVVGLPVNEAIDLQVEVLDAPTQAEGEFTTGYWPVEGEPEQLCGVVQVFSWLDESTTTVRTCIANPKPELVPLEEPVAGFGNTSECTIPPAGYETLWCEERAYICREWQYTPEGSMNEEALRACEHYGDVCGIETEAASTASGPRETEVTSVADTTAAPAPSEAPNMSQGDETRVDRDDDEPQLRGIEPREGCTAAPMSHEGRAPYALLGVAGLSFGLSWRRRRSVQRPSARDVR